MQPQPTTHYIPNYISSRPNHSMVDPSFKHINQIIHSVNILTHKFDILNGFALFHRLSCVIFRILEEMLDNECLSCIGHYVMTLCWYLGAIKLGLMLWKLVTPLAYFKQNLYKKYEGGWAVVTGASDGIGLAFCQQLAEESFNICMISRSKAKLNQAKELVQLKNKNIEIKTIECDFLNLTTVKDYEKLASQLEDLDISILVNNVGVFNCKKFIDLTQQELDKEMIVNCLPIALLTRLLLPKILTRPKSAIINLSSAATVSLSEITCNYNATKAFDDYLSQALSFECSQKVDVMSLRPFLVTSNMTRNMKTLLHVSTTQCVRSALKDVGRVRYSYGHFFHHVQGVIGETLDSYIMRRIFGIIMKQLKKEYDRIDLETIKE